MSTPEPTSSGCPRRPAGHIFRPMPNKLKLARSSMRPCWLLRKTFERDNYPEALCSVDIRKAATLGRMHAIGGDFSNSWEFLPVEPLGSCYRVESHTTFSRLNGLAFG